MPVPMMDLKAQYAPMKQEIDTAVLAVLESQQFRGGVVVEAFERAVADFIGVPHALGVSDGTNAILLALRAVGLKRDEEVITTPFTFFATGGATANAGGIPIFVDIDPVTFNIDVAQIEAKITPRTRALLPVHIFGQCADMDPILALAEKHGLAVIEDSAQSLGAKYKGRSACSMGDAGTISYYPSKNLGGAGEGGMIATRKHEVAEQVRLLRGHGAGKTYFHDIIGTNCHLHAIQAAVLGVKLKFLAQWNEKRRDIANRYHAALGQFEEIVLPQTLPGNEHVWHQYVIRIPRRDAALALQRERGIECGVFYPLPLHRQKCFAQLPSANAQCPEADKASSEVLALPIFPEMTDGQQDQVVNALRDHLTRK